MSNKGNNTWGPYPLTSEYRVMADSYCYSLQRKNIVKEEGSKNFGMESWITEGYYGRIQHLLDRLLNIQIAENLGDLGRAIERIDEVEAHLDNLVKIKNEREASWKTITEKQNTI